MPPKKQQETLSAFFTPSKKRPSETIDLTGDDDSPLPPSKRPRGPSTRHESPYFSGSPAPSSSRNTLPQPTASVVEEYGYSAGKPTDLKPRTVSQQKRHEAFKKRLLLDNASFLPNGEPPEEEGFERGHGAGSEASEPESEGEGSDDQFERLQAMFANKKGKSVRKGKVAKSQIAQKPSKKAAEIGPSGEPYTPLELQVRQLKQDNPGTLLMVEVGYKYKFYDEDAKTAAKELGMAAFRDRNFIVASIPTHRRDIHLKKLLSQGYRVGIVNQIETAALKKAGNNKAGPFERKLTHLYTDTTYVDEIDSVDDSERSTPPPMLCIVEEWSPSKPENTSFGLVSICPTTGDVVWDNFDDKFMRIELETRLSHLQPAEILQPRSGLSEATARMLSSFTGTSTTGNKIRHEYFDKAMSSSEAFERVSQFYTDKTKFGAASESFRSGQLMAAITDFPKRVVVALAHAIKHLSEYGVADAFLETRFFSVFATRAHMLLSANTLTNLEIYRNETDGSVRGSLMWILDRTKTKFGARLLRSWVGRPLIDKRLLQERVDAVQEIVESTTETLLTLRDILKRLPDLAKGLSRIQYGQCTPEELAILLPAFSKVADAFAHNDFQESEDVGCQSQLLNEIIFALPKLKQPVDNLLEQIHLKRAANGDKDHMWADEDKYPDITGAICYLVEVKKKENRPVPDDWILHSGTKFISRYRTPSVSQKVEELAQCQERLGIASKAAFQSFLQEIASNHYGILRDAVNKLAIADCLLSLAQVSMGEGYVRPEFVDDDVMEIEEGRHPMIQELFEKPYIPNTIRMGGGEARSKIITGPNMGGKSSCVRTIALVAIMAQIGSYVPASSVRMKLLDGVLTRMGASDDILRGQSTFMVEMSETREILDVATDRSLVILDELGRGTSTFDGMAIADAVLHYLVQTKKSKTLFITHYPMVATRLQKRFPADLENLHMQYASRRRIDGTREITFLYNLTSGLAPESFGIECGRLAGLPDNLLQTASQYSDQLRHEVEERMKRNK
ncbi:DNA mismatch repair protein MSH3 [Coprinopsis sp. MPI-PUGE-AT-0042]|nr:DNA mismatch repair protein MSH3 [Coprinopsis sp. MPI-PUGE-AT-0042]